MKKENLLATLFIVIVMVFSIGMLFVTSMTKPRGVGGKIDVNYYYGVDIRVEDDLLPYYAVTKPNEYELIYIPYNKVYVMYHTDEWLSNDCPNILKETTYTSLLSNKKETDYELYIFVQESKGGIQDGKIN